MDTKTISIVSMLIQAIMMTWYRVRIDSDKSESPLHKSGDIWRVASIALVLQSAIRMEKIEFGMRSPLLFARDFMGIWEAENSFKLNITNWEETNDKIIQCIRRVINAWTFTLPNGKSIKYFPKDMENICVGKIIESPGLIDQHVVSSTGFLPDLRQANLVVVLRDYSVYEAGTETFVGNVSAEQIKYICRGFIFKVSGTDMRAVRTDVERRDIYAERVYSVVVLSSDGSRHFGTAVQGYRRGYFVEVAGSRKLITDHVIEEDGTVVVSV